MKTALITGVAGQDGAHLSTLLREQGYRVVGLVQADTEVPPEVAAHLAGVELVHGDLRDTESIRAAVTASDPDEVYNLAGVSSVALSWQQPELTADVNGTAVLRLLRVLMEHADRTGRAPRLLQASSSGAARTARASAPAAAAVRPERVAPEFPTGASSAARVDAALPGLGPHDRPALRGIQQEPGRHRGRRDRAARPAGRGPDRIRQTAPGQRPGHRPGCALG